jgi:uncharacterized protein YegJ (DUF2314 family)
VIHLVMLGLLALGCNRFRFPETEIVVSAGEETAGILEEAAERARAGFPAFLRRLQNPDDGETHFRVKYPFPAGGASGFRFEEIWLGDIVFREGRFFGTVANTPLVIKNLAPGDEVTFNAGEIRDWLYIRDGRIVGGYSIPPLRRLLPEDAALPATLSGPGEN